MTKEKNQEAPIIDVQETISKTEAFIEKNKKILSITVGSIVAIILIYVGYKKFYIAPLEEEAKSAIFMAEKYFEKDSFNLALNGDSINLGFIAIADEYSITQTGNLAKYYAGICYLRLGEYEKAIEYLKKFSCDDHMLKPISIGALGDAYMELGKTEEAIKYYMKAAESVKNNFTTPIYLMKAALAYEDIQQYDKAIDIYKRLKTEFIRTNEGREAEKYLSRLLAIKGEYNR